MYFCWLEFWDGFVHPWLQQNQTHPVMKGLMSFLWLFDLTRPPQAERRRVSSTQTHTHECVTQDYSAQCYLIKSGKSTRGKDKLKQKIINWAQSHRDGETQTHMNIQPHFKHTYINYKKNKKSHSFHADFCVFAWRRTLSLRLLSSAYWVCFKAFISLVCFLGMEQIPWRWQCRVLPVELQECKSSLKTPKWKNDASPQLLLEVSKHASQRLVQNHSHRLDKWCLIGCDCDR